MLADGIVYVPVVIGLHDYEELGCLSLPTTWKLFPHPAILVTA